MIGIALNYAADKYILLKRCHRPDYLSPKLSHVIVYLIGFSFCQFLLGTFLFNFSDQTKKEFSIERLLILVVTIAGMIMENWLSRLSMVVNE